MADRAGQLRVHSPAAAGVPSGELVAAAACAATLGAVACGALTEQGEVGEVLPCAFQAVTGLPCPFCGMTRSLLAVGGGDWRASFDLHPLGPVVLLLAVVGLVRLGRAAVGRAYVRVPRGAVAGGLGVLLVAWAFQLAGALT